MLRYALRRKLEAKGVKVTIKTATSARGPKMPRLLLLFALLKRCLSLAAGLLACHCPGRSAEGPPGAERSRDPGLAT